MVMNDQILKLWNDHRSVRRLLLNRFQAAMSKDGLSLAQSELLFNLYKRQSLATPSLLAKELQLTPGAISQLLDGLEQADYIKRVHSESDRRVCMVVPSDAANAKIRRFKAHQHKLVKDIQNVLTPDELETLVKIQQKVIAYLKQADSPNDKEEKA